MGHKVNPIGLRVGINRTWDSRWYAEGEEYAKLLLEDLNIREHLKHRLTQAGVSRIVIERPAKKARITIHSARPGIIIGRKGADIETLRKELSKKVGSEVHLNIVEIRKPELDAQLVAESIANGVSVVQMDLDDELDFADNDSFDLVILSQTLQQTRRPDQLMRKIVRVGRLAAISMLNFGYLSCRMQLLLRGSMPRTRDIPYQWYNTPNIHHATIKDFRRLCRHLDIRIIQEIPIGPSFPLFSRRWPNLFAVGCVFLLEKAEDGRADDGN